MRGLLVIVIMPLACNPSPAARTDAGPGPAPTTSASTASAAVTADFAETDFAGSFNGAKVYATLRTEHGLVTGSCFYEAFGVDIPLRGSATPDGIVFDEMNGSAAVSTTTLKKESNGYGGVWKSAAGQKSGAAVLSVVVPEPGKTVFVGKRHVHKASLERCSSTLGKPSAPCELDGDMPVVLGLADRAFEKVLDAELAKTSDMYPPSNPVGARVALTFSILMNERGFLSLQIGGQYLSERACDANGGSGCIGLYAYTHQVNTLYVVAVAFDSKKISSSLADFVDTKRSGVWVKRLVADGFTRCAAAQAPSDAMQAVWGAAPTPAGLQVCHEGCQEHVAVVTCDVVPYGKIGASLRADSAFAQIWK